MATEDEREIYRQRFESERSAYRLEWQLFQVGVAIGLVTLGIGENAFSPNWWQFLISGAVFVKFSYAMQRISKGFSDNRIILRKYACRVGDSIAQDSKWWESAALRSRLLLHAVGVSLLIAGVWIADCIPLWVQVVFTVLLPVEWLAWSEWQVNCIRNSQKWIRRVIIALFCILFILAIIATVICVHCRRDDSQENNQSKSFQCTDVEDESYLKVTPTNPSKSAP